MEIRIWDGFTILVLARSWREKHWVSMLKSSNWHDIRVIYYPHFPAHMLPVVRSSVARCIGTSAWQGKSGGEGREVEQEWRLLIGWNVCRHSVRNSRKIFRIIFKICSILWFKKMIGYYVNEVQNGKWKLLNEWASIGSGHTASLVWFWRPPRLHSSPHMCRNLAPMPSCSILTSDCLQLLSRPLLVWHDCVADWMRHQFPDCFCLNTTNDDASFLFAYTAQHWLRYSISLYFFTYFWWCYIVPFKIKVKITVDFDLYYVVFPPDGITVLLLNLFCIEISPQQWCGTVSTL